MNKKLSIITVNLNNAIGLRKTIESVVSQSFTDYEYIIIDGGSTDGSLEIINEFGERITYWVCEPDKGIFNAMNKGIKVAKGEYCLFLNSGDLLTEKNRLQQVFDLNPIEDIVYCNILTDKNDEWTYPDSLSIFFFATKCIGHPATFIKTYLFGKYGNYNESYKITADYDFFLKTILLNSASYNHLNIFLTLFNTEGVSSKQLLIKEKEKLYSLKQNFLKDFDDIHRYIKDQKDLHFYQNSRLIQFLKKLQSNNIYRHLRKVNN